MTDNNEDDDRSGCERIEETFVERDRQEKLESARRQAILANPDGVTLPKIMDALDTLDDDQFERWLDEHPDIRDQAEAHFRDIFDELQNIFEMLPEEAIEAYNQRVEFTPNEGLYTKTTLETPAGERHPAGLLSLWSTRRGGEILIDIRERNVPDGSDLVGSRIEIYNDDAILLLAGEIVDTGGRMAGEGIINNQTVVLKPDR